MTLAFRNQILTLFVFISLILLVLFGVLAVTAVQQYGWGLKLPAAHHQVFWFFYAVENEAPLWNNLVNVGIASATVFGGLIYLRHLYRKTTSVEVFFAAAFLFGLGFETLRLLQPFILQENGSFFFGILVTRVVYLFRVFSLLTLFLGSLYFLDFKYQKYGAMIGLSLLVSLMVAASIPLDTTAVDTNLLYGLADERGLGYSFLVFQVLIVINILLGRIQGNHRNLIRLLLIQGLLLVGWQFALFSQPWSVLALVPAVLLLGRKAQAQYLWA